MRHLMLLALLLPANLSAVSITINSSPTAQAFTVEGNGCAPGTYAAPQTVNWTTGANCTVTFVSPHSVQLGIQYYFSNWQDGPALNPRTIAAPAQPAVYTANFTAQYLVTTAANPPQG